MIQKLLDYMDKGQILELHSFVEDIREDRGYDLTPFVRNSLEKKGYNFFDCLSWWPSVIPFYYYVVLDDTQVIPRTATHVYAPTLPTLNLSLHPNPSVTHLFLNLNRLPSKNLGKMFPNLKFLCVYFSQHIIDALDFISLENCLQWSPLTHPVWSRWTLGDTPTKLVRPLVSKCVPFLGLLIPQELLINDSLRRLPYRMPTWIPKRNQ